MKKNRTKKPALRVIEDSQPDRDSVGWARDMSELAIIQIRQLQSIAQLIASGNRDGSDYTETDRTDILAVMTLFSRNLAQVTDILGEAVGILRRHEPDLVAVNH